MRPSPLRVPIRFEHRIPTQQRLEVAAWIFALLTALTEHMHREADVRVYWECHPTETGVLFLGYPAPPGVDVAQLPVLSIVDQWLGTREVPVHPCGGEVVSDE